MQLVVVDITPALRASLLGRVQEASRQAGLQRVTVVDVDPLNLDSVAWDATIGCFIGAGCGAMIKEILGKLQGERSACPVAVVLDSESYASDAVAIHKLLGRTVIADTDLTQMATFVIDCERTASGRREGVRLRHIVGFVQLKGGVGTSSLVAAVGSALALRGMTVVAIDFDDVCPQLTEWARVPTAQRTLVGELVRSGEVEMDRLRDLVYPVEGFDGRFVVVGQPVHYAEGFHLRSYVLDGAPSAGEFTSSLLALLSSEYEVVLVDAGRSWGVSTFAALPWCERVVLVTDDDGLSVRRSFDSLARLRGESGDSEEFNLGKWIVAFNRYTGDRLTVSDVQRVAESVEIFPKAPPILPISESKRGRQWGAVGETLYTLGERRVISEIENLMHAVVPSAEARERTIAAKKGGKLLGRWL